MAAAAVLTLAGFSTMNVAGRDTVSGNESTPPLFWDDIPVSPSTTVPEKIEVQLDMEMSS